MYCLVGISTCPCPWPVQISALSIYLVAYCQGALVAGDDTGLPSLGEEKIRNCELPFSGQMISGLLASLAFVSRKFLGLDDTTPLYEWHNFDWYCITGLNPISLKGSASPHAQGMWKLWCHTLGQRKFIDMKTSIQLLKSFHYWFNVFVVYIQPRQILHGKHKVTVQFAPLSCIDESLNVEIPKSWQIGSQQNQF